VVVVTAPPANERRRDTTVQDRPGNRMSFCLEGVGEWRRTQSFLTSKASTAVKILLLGWAVETCSWADDERRCYP
jgi:hypothetical protein